MREFKIGDRVRCVNDEGWHVKILGKYGTIVDYVNQGYSIEFDDFIEGHNCGHKAKNGHGWYLGENSIVKIGEVTEEKLYANDYQILAGRTINDELTSDEKELHALHGMTAEVGELHSLYQKVYQGHIASTEHAKKEVGDLLWFIAEYCTANGWKLEDIMQLNIDKLKARYPEGFETDRSIHRKADDI